MRMTSLLATCAMAWALSVGGMWAPQGPSASPFTGEVSLCLIPMKPVAAQVGSCSDHTPPWSGVEGLLNPE